MSANITTKGTAHKIAFVGLGIMGRPMALNLLKAGHEIFAYARRPESLEPLCKAGAQACASPKDAMAQSDFAITIVSDTPDVESVILGADGLADGANTGNIIIDMTTCDPIATRGIAEKLSARGIDMLDAPVSGGEPGAISGELSIMVGGDEAVFKKALPLFSAMGKNIVHIGGAGTGQVAKACNQLVVAQTITSTAEMMVLARSLKADPARVREALLGGFAKSRILELHGKRMLDEEYAPGFKAHLFLKDFDIIGGILKQLELKLPGAELSHKRLQSLVKDGGGELDCSALAKVVNKQSRK